MMPARQLSKFSEFAHAGLHPGAAGFAAR